MTKRVRIYISGHVQGVFFRAECARRARDRGLAGFARNLADGRVEAAFEGEDASVDALVNWCREGTSGADVENIEVVAEDPLGEDDFRVR
jgi:acylphosphatase